MNKYTVIVSFTSDCCTKPHLWMQGVEASSEDEAARKVRADLESGKQFGDSEDDEGYGQEYNVSDYVVLPGLFLGASVKDYEAL
jgi:hypothetical protein